MFSSAVRDRLIARYREPHRRYHTLAHVTDCLAQAAASTDLTTGQRDLLETALWFHDAIYDPSRRDNEAESARLAREELTADGATEDHVAEVERLVGLTAGHAADAADVLGARMVSIDLSILGAGPAVYDSYVRGVRQEYGHVPEKEWRAGRQAVLQRFLDSPQLYPDPAWAARFEARARANIARELDSLRG
ncbi:phosphohydrolase [Brevundimonas sp.]|uniref:HD domain-containing protein n=1 Tax=Brevundimonas sp. TaxID=1871086 RepID=UPI0035ADD486